MFHRRFPEVRIGRHQLRSIYKEYGIKKKAIRQRKFMKAKDLLRAKEQTKDCQEKVKALME